MTERSLKYRAYLGSMDWFIRRANALAAAGQQCERCHGTTRLQVHHRTYDRLGAELPADLEVLCADCHAQADRERAEASAVRSANALYSARVEGWARKVYGDDWEDRVHWDELTEEFDGWLADREGSAW